MDVDKNLAELELKNTPWEEDIMNIDLEPLFEKIRQLVLLRPKDARWGVLQLIVEELEKGGYFFCPL